jgi:uncharacterized coiled-coil protein SlyX
MHTKLAAQRDRAARQRAERLAALEEKLKDRDEQAAQEKRLANADRMIRGEDKAA